MTIDLQANNYVEQLLPHLEQQDLVDSHYICLDNNNTIHLISKQTNCLKLLFYRVILGLFTGFRFDATEACSKMAGRIQNLLNEEIGDDERYNLLKTALLVQAQSNKILQKRSNLFVERATLYATIQEFQVILNSLVTADEWAASASHDIEDHDIDDNNEPLLNFYNLYTRLNEELPPSQLKNDLLALISGEISVTRIIEAELTIEQRISLAKTLPTKERIEALLLPLDPPQKQELITRLAQDPVRPLAPADLCRLSFYFLIRAHNFEAALILQLLSGQAADAQLSERVPSSTELTFTLFRYLSGGAINHLAEEEKALSMQFMYDLLGSGEARNFTLEQRADLLLFDRKLFHPPIIRNHAHQNHYYTADVYAHLPAQSKNDILDAIALSYSDNPMANNPVKALEAIEAMDRGNPRTSHQLLQAVIERGSVAMLQALLNKNILPHNIPENAFQVMQAQPADVRIPKFILLLKEGSIPESEAVLALLLPAYDQAHLRNALFTILELRSQPLLNLLEPLLHLFSLSSLARLKVTAKAVPENLWWELLEHLKVHAPQFYAHLSNMRYEISLTHMRENPPPPPAPWPENFDVRETVFQIAQEFEMGLQTNLTPLPYNKVHLRTFLNNCASRALIVGTPGNDAMRVDYYKLMERYINSIKQRIDELVVQHQNDPSEANRQAVQTARRNLLGSLARAGSACGGRYISETREIYLRAVCNRAINFHSRLLETLREYRQIILEGFDQHRDAHVSNGITKAYGRQLGLLTQEEWAALNDPSAYWLDGHETMATHFANNYTPEKIIQFLHDKLRNDGDFRESYIDWWKENLTEVQLEEVEGDDRDDKAMTFIGEKVYSIDTGELLKSAIISSLKQLRIIDEEAPSMATRFTAVLLGAP